MERQIWENPAAVFPEKEKEESDMRSVSGNSGFIKTQVRSFLRGLAAVSAAAVLFVASSGKAVFAEEPEASELYAQSACLMDGTSGRVLYGKESGTPLPMASTTKIMTCILALEQADLKQTVTASARAAGQPKVHLGVKEGQQFVFEDLLYALMLESFNDAAVMIAEGVAGSVEGFADMMNKKAEEIGCKDTHFVTPNGLDAQDDGGIHHTTAEDLALMMRYCIRQSEKSQEFLDVTQTASYTFWDVEHTQVYTCNNHNSFLQMMDGAISGKTGFTSKAGYCYVGALEKDGKCLIVALLACGWPDNRSYKWSDTKKLMNYGLEEYSWKDVFLHDWEPGEVPVAGGQYEGVLGTDSATVPLRLDVDGENEILNVLMREDEEITVRTDLPERLTAPVREGIQVGEVSYLLDGEEIAVYPVYTGASSSRIDFWWSLGQITERYELLSEA